MDSNYSNLEHILDKNAFKFEATSESDTMPAYFLTIINLNESNMIISDDVINKFTVRNSKNLSVIKTIGHKFGSLRCGLCYPEQKVVVLGINDNLVEFNYEEMKIIKNVKTQSIVLLI